MAASAMLVRSTSKNLRRTWRVSLRPKPSVPSVTYHRGTQVRKVGNGPHIVRGRNHRLGRGAQAFLHPGWLRRFGGANSISALDFQARPAQFGEAGDGRW